MASHSTIKDFYSARGGQRQIKRLRSSRHAIRHSAEYSRLDQILQQYTSWLDSQYPDTGELRRLLDDVTDDEKMELLKGHQPLWRAAHSYHPEIISTILSSLSPHQRLDVLSVRHMSIPPLHWAACMGNTDSVKMILSQLTSEQQLTLLSMTWGGRTPADCASECGNEETERLLRDYEQRAKQQTEVVARHENLPVSREDLAAALCRIKKLEDQLQVQQKNSAEVFVRYEELLVRHDDLTARHEDLAAGCVRALDRIRELEDRLQVQQNNSAGHGCSSITQQTSNGLDQMVYDVIARHERDNEGWQALRQMVLNNSAGIAILRDLTQENRNALTAQGLHEADTKQPEEN